MNKLGKQKPIELYGGSNELIPVLNLLVSQLGKKSLGQKMKGGYQYKKCLAMF